MLQRHNGKIMVTRVIDFSLEEVSKSKVRRPPSFTRGVSVETEYVKQLKRELEQHERDILAARNNKVKKVNHICVLLLEYLQIHCEQTTGRIARDLNFSIKIIENVGNYLIRRKLIIKRRNKRSYTTYQRTI